MTTVVRARKLERFLSQPFFVAEVFTGSPGKYVKLEETIKGFQMICPSSTICPSFLHGRQIKLTQSRKAQSKG